MSSTENIDLSGELDTKLESASSLSTKSFMASLPMSPSAATAWVSSRRQHVKPWSEFLNSSRFHKPTSVASVGSRVVKNLDYFLSNYMFVFLGLIIFCIMTSPLLLIAIGLCGGACYMITVKNQVQPVKFLGKELTISQQYAAVAAMSFPLLWLSGAGGAVFWIIGASFFLIGLHATFYQQFDNGSGFDVDMDEISIS